MGYLYRFLKPSHAYSANWQEMRRRRKVYWISTALLFPVMVLLCGLVSPLCSLLQSDLPVFIVAMAVMAAYTAVHVYRLKWPCPRCGRPFFWAWWPYPPMACRCLHCGLELYAPCDPAHQQWEFESHVGPTDANAV
jgi:hypothetical protein